MALLLGAVGGAWLGAAAVHAAPGYGALEVTLAVTTILFAGWTLQRETRQSLVLLCAAFLAHALIDVGASPGVAGRGPRATLVHRGLRRVRCLPGGAMLLGSEAVVVMRGPVEDPSLPSL